MRPGDRGGMSADLYNFLLEVSRAVSSLEVELRGIASPEDALVRLSAEFKAQLEAQDRLREAALAGARSEAERVDAERRKAVADALAEAAAASALARTTGATVQAAQASLEARMAALEAGSASGSPAPWARALNATGTAPPARLGSGTPDVGDVLLGTGVWGTLSEAAGRQTLTDGAIISWDVDNGSVASVTLGGNRTLDVPTGGEDGDFYMLRVIQDSTGGRMLDFAAGISSVIRGIPMLSPEAAAIDLLLFTRIGSTVYFLGSIGTPEDAPTPDPADWALKIGASGTAPPARLGSGAASVSSVLRGDNTWGDAPARPVTIQTLTDGAMVNWNVDNGEVADLTLGGNRTLALPTGGADGEFYVLRVRQDSTGSRTLTLAAAIRTSFADAPTLSTAPNAIDMMLIARIGTLFYLAGFLKGT